MKNEEKNLQILPKLFFRIETRSIFIYKKIHPKRQKKLERLIIPWSDFARHIKSHQRPTNIYGKILGWLILDFFCQRHFPLWKSTFFFLVSIPLGPKFLIFLRHSLWSQKYKQTPRNTLLWILWILRKKVKF